MSDQDFKIVSELIRNPLESYEKIGSKVGLSGISTRSRILKMHSSGFIQGMYLIPSPLNFGRHPRFYVFKNVDSPFSKLSEISTVSGVVFAWIDYDNDLIVTVFSRSEKERVRDVARLSKILGTNAITDHIPISLLPPNLSSSGLSRIDWKVLEHVAFNPRISIAEVSKLTHLSRKTVQAHLNRMISNRMLYTVYISDFTKGNGGIYYGLLVFYETKEVLGQLLKLNLEPVWYMSEPLGALLLGFAESLEVVELLKKRVGNIEGVTGFSLNIPRGGMFAEKSVRIWIRKEINKWNSASFH
jgi:DNA-binding Lrp family transcriptional regulator